MKNLLQIYKLCALWLLLQAPALLTAQWATVATDLSGDGNTASLPDGLRFEYWYKPVPDSVYFRITVADITGAKSENFGVNIMVNIPGDATFNFWGSANTAKWTTLVTAWVNGTPPSNYAGTIGVANAVGVGQKNYTNLSSGTVSIVIDTVAGTITLGMKRVNLVSNPQMAGSSSITMKAAAAVGSSSTWNDDIYSTNASITLSNVNTSLRTPAPGFLAVYPNPTSGLLTAEFETDETPCEIIITDMKGVQHKPALSITGSTVTINTAGLAAGIYYINATTTTGIYCGKAVVLP